MKTIAAVDQNWAIGNKGELLVHISADMKNFRRETSGKVVIYGRKTLETFPGGKPLKNRVNIILSRRPDYCVEGAYTAHSPEEAVQILKKECASYTMEDVFVIGGDSIYRQMLPYCSTALITRVESSFEADAWFPDLDQDPEWTLAERGENQEEEGLVFHFDRYERIR